MVAPKKVNNTRPTSVAYTLCESCLVDDLKLAQAELNAIDWNSVRDGNRLRASLVRLLTAIAPEQVEAAYWGLENYVVVQGEVFPGALECCRVLGASLAEIQSTAVLVKSLDLLYQILSGYPSAGMATEEGLIEECKIVMRRYRKWLEAAVSMPVGEAAQDVLNAL